MNKTKSCKYCGMPILLLRTSINKTTPCNAAIVHYYKNPESRDEIVTAGGEKIKATIIPDDVLLSAPSTSTTTPQGCVGHINAINIYSGYAVHRNHCPNYKNKEATL